MQPKSSFTAVMIVLVSALAVYKGQHYYANHAVPSHIPQGLLLSSAASNAQAGEVSDFCVGKERCAVVYVAPWCSACKQVLPSLLKARDHWKDSPNRGMKFIVGNSTLARDVALAQELGASAFVDDNDAFAKKMSVEHFPTIWILDEKNKVLLVDQPAIAWLNNELNR